MGTELVTLLRERKQRFLDTMSVTWDLIIAAASERSETSPPEKVDTHIRVLFQGTEFQIASRPIIPLQGDFDPFDPEHRKAKIVE